MRKRWRRARREEEELARQEAKKQPPKKMGFIAVSIGEGLSEIFKDLGVDYLIEGDRP